MVSKLSVLALCSMAVVLSCRKTQQNDDSETNSWRCVNSPGDYYNIQSGPRWQSHQAAKAYAASIRPSCKCGVFSGPFINMIGPPGVLDGAVGGISQTSLWGYKIDGHCRKNSFFSGGGQNGGGQGGGGGGGGFG